MFVGSKKQKFVGGKRTNFYIIMGGSTSSPAEKSTVKNFRFLFRQSWGRMKSCWEMKDYPPWVVFMSHHRLRPITWDLGNFSKGEMEMENLVGIQFR